MYQELDEDYIEIKDFMEVTVKGAYDNIPAIKYPLITILEIQNTENTRFTDNNGEHISNLTYQIECYSRDTERLQATESAMLMGRTVNALLTGPRYKMTRIGNPTIMGNASTSPFTNDRDIIRYVQRYSCSVNLDTHIIYKQS